MEKKERLQKMVNAHMRSKRRKSGIDEEYIRLIVCDELLQIMNGTLMQAVSEAEKGGFTMSIEGYVLLLLIFVGLYWLGYKINPPIDEGHPITPEPNQMLADVRGEQE